MLCLAKRLCSLLMVVSLLSGTDAKIALGDPCGMVPPIYVGNEVPIARVGLQQTYVFYQDGVETVVIRPGFKGKVDEFGMLIPFPSVPSLRKVPDHIFPHLEKAVDPPEVVIDLRYRLFLRNARAGAPAPTAAPSKNDSLAFRHQVRVVKEEAVGMYEVAVLEAGSAAALKRWMDDHNYVYPKGMDEACEDYVELGWCFVAVKTKVGQKKGVNPRPGMRKVNPQLPDSSTFDGSVQGMGFRFLVDEMVVPMRLSTFNEGDLHNLVYILSGEPMKIQSIPEEYVVRQISGKQLLQNLTGPLPLRIIGGTVDQLQQWHKRNLAQRRDPVPHNGAAKDLIASDLLAAITKQLSHPHEETEKMLLMVGERLKLRGPEIDKLNNDSLKLQREEIAKKGLAGLKENMTLTVIDGNFPREVIANQNLKFASFKMPSRRNNSESYDLKTHKPGGKKSGVLILEKVSELEKENSHQKVSSLVKPASSSLSYFVWSVMSLCVCCVAGMYYCRVMGTRK